MCISHDVINKADLQTSHKHTDHKTNTYKINSKHKEGRQCNTHLLHTTTNTYHHINILEHMFTHQLQL